jgi:signal transduction histidine kinase
LTPPKSILRAPAIVAAVGLAYFAAARFGLSLAFAAEQVTVVWPPTGIALAAILLLGRASIPGIFAGALAANLTVDQPAVTALGIATGNTLAAVAAAALLRWAAFDPALERLRDVLALFGLAAGAAPGVSATIGVVSLCLTGLYPWSAFGGLWRVWWLGDAIGVVLAGPLLLTSARPLARGWPTRRLPEAALLFATLGAVSVIVFTQHLGPAHHLVYAVFPFVIWSALRFSQRETSAVLVLIETLAVLGAVWGRGPFAGSGPQERLVLLQLFMAVTAATALLLGAAIAERARAEEQRARLLAELKAALSAKDEFLAILGHELRNPLAPLRNAAEVLAARAASDPAIERIQKIIERQVRHMVRLVDDLLDVSRIARGRVELRRERVSLAEVVRRAAEAVRPLVDERGHALALDVPTQPVMVHGDPVRLEQVFSNLLHNAARYTDPGGRLAVSLSSEADAAVVRVSDDGAGIAGERLESIFELFVQGERRTRRAAEGLGIGLTLARSLAEMHGGTVSAKSDGPGRGSEFTVRLPVAGASADEEAPAVEPPAGIPPSVAARRVLVVDDNVDAAESLAIVLRGAGHEVATAHDGASGLAAASSGRFEVVLLDIALPDELDGYEIARRLRADPGLRGLRLVALTGFGQDEDRRRAAEAGFDDHLVKPVGPERLAAALAAG